ncbi:MAG: hypothetical protein HOC23_24175 [Halieaceae bacterium]|jgi:hypothetical protein|nr:hypothetical protein [Halieaceae bacterium]
MRLLAKAIGVLGMILLVASLSGCSDPQVYGSVGVSSGYSSYGHHRGGWNSGVRTSISVGGRIY